MSWVALNTRHLREASYDAKRQQLTIRTGKGAIRKHRGVLPHMFDNLVNSDDKEFYYRFYVEPSLVSNRYAVGRFTGYILKLGVIGGSALLLSASGFVI